MSTPGDQGNARTDGDGRIVSFPAESPPGAPGPSGAAPAQLRLPVTTILLLAAISFSGLAISAVILTQVTQVPVLVQAVIPVAVMMALYGLSYIFLERHWIIAGQAALVTGVLIFGFAVYILSDVLRVTTHWPDQILIWAIGTLGAAIIVPSRAALALSLLLASVWSSAESIYFFTPLHWPFLVFWAVCFAITNFLHWRPGIYVGLFTLAAWLGLNSLSISNFVFWERIHISGLHVLLWLGVWVLSRILTTFRYEFAHTFERAALGLTLVSLLFLMDSFTYSPDLRFDWLVTAILAAAVVLLLSAVALARQGIEIIDVVMVGTMAAFAIAYPTFYDTLYYTLPSPYGILVLNGILFVVWATWTILLGRREQDNLLIAFGCVGVGVQLFLIFASFATGEINLAVMLAVGGSLIIILVIVLDRLRQRLGPPRTDVDSDPPDTDIHVGDTTRRGDGA